MSYRAKTSWRVIRVQDSRSPADLPASERLVALYRLQTGEASGELAFSAYGTTVRSGTDVEWEGFPVVAALEAVTCDELRRLRGLLGTDVTPDANRVGVSWPFTLESPPSEV